MNLTECCRQSCSKQRQFIRCYCVNSFTATWLVISGILEVQRKNSGLVWTSIVTSRIKHAFLSFPQDKTIRYGVHLHLKNLLSIQRSPNKLRPVLSRTVSRHYWKTDTFSISIVVVRWLIALSSTALREDPPKCIVFMLKYLRSFVRVTYFFLNYLCIFYLRQS